MKKIIPIMIISLVLLFTACEKKDNKDNKDLNTIQVNGDIKEVVLNVDYSSMKSIEFTEKENTLQGVLLSDILSKSTFLQEESKSLIMITAKDGTSAVIEAETSDMCYVVLEDGIFNIKAPAHPRVVGIKDVADITVIAEDTDLIPYDSGIKIVENSNEVLSYGNAKLLLFTKSGENRQNGNLSIKYVKKESVSAYDFIGGEGIIYLENFDIIKIDKANVGDLIWENGRVLYNNSGNKSPIIGVVKGTDSVIYDSYYKMKELIDKNEKIMFFETDGFSYEQCEYFKEELFLFAQNSLKTASVNPAISNVALASIITGKTPYHTEITERMVKKPSCQDIFEYATEKGKTVKYIEGNANLIVTSVKPILNSTDSNGYSDLNVFLAAQKALKDNPDLLFVHFHGIDDANHDYSPYSTESKEKILEVEQYISELIKDYDGNVIIISDHGSVTIEDNGTKTGKHGVFRVEDMFVPFFFFERGSF